MSQLQVVRCESCALPPPPPRPPPAYQPAIVTVVHHDDDDETGSSQRPTLKYIAKELNRLTILVVLYLILVISVYVIMLGFVDSLKSEILLYLFRNLSGLKKELDTLNQMLMRCNESRKL
jgi:hypothetical protein